MTPDLDPDDTKDSDPAPTCTDCDTPLIWQDQGDYWCCPVCEPEPVEDLT